jgi:hypothetical protein
MVGLGSVTNNAQTQSAVVPNTAPSAGQDLVGNSGGTAYAPVAMSGDCTRASTGAITCTKTSGTLFGTGATATIANYAPLASPTFTGTVTTPLTTAGLVTTSSGGALSSEALATAAQGGTGVANTATLTLGSSNRNYATLGTGIEKNTTTTGAVTDAAAADIYGLFTSCTGSSGLFLKDGGTCAAPSGGGLSGMTASQVPIAATASTVTSSKALSGSGSGITTGPASGVTTLDVAEFTGTGGQIADSGVLVSSLALASSVPTTRTWLFSYQGVCQAGVTSFPVNFPTVNSPAYVPCDSTHITPEFQIPGGSTSLADTFGVKLRVPPGVTGAYTLTTTYRSVATTGTVTVQPTYACVVAGAVPDNPSFSNAGSTFTLTPAGTTAQNVTTTDTFTPTCVAGADLYVLYTFTANTVTSADFINFSYISLAVQGSL